MNSLVRRAVLIIAWAALALGALYMVLLPSWNGTPAGQAVPRPVPEGDQEVAWLNAATNAVGWERFVSAIQRLHEKHGFGLEMVESANAFPSQSTAVPELAVRVRGSSSRLWFRWYKMTGDIGSSQWVEALSRRNPPPLAIIGGGSSDRARDLARDLDSLRAEVASPPLLLITTATADKVDVNHKKCDLMKLYAGRSFRFCFTNQQMAEATSDFIWSQDELRPDGEPVYLVHWNDDPYSLDLFDRFRDVLSGDRFNSVLRRQQNARLAVRKWAWLTGRAATGSVPAGLDFEGLRYDDLGPGLPYWSAQIPYTQGPFNQPNYWEAEAAERMIDEVRQHPGQSRPLLIMPANPQSGRRFLRALVRIAPVEAGRFVVANGDGIDFNVVYRDRMLAWPIQDLPVSLILFCHRNPVDPEAFEPARDASAQRIPDSTGMSDTGTQDLLLYQDMVGVIAQASFRLGRLVTTPDDLKKYLQEAHGQDGLPRFDDKGNLVSGTGEFVVWLQPVRIDERVKPRAVLRVWQGHIDPEGGRTWALDRQLEVDYLQAPPTR